MNNTNPEPFPLNLARKHNKKKLLQDIGPANINLPTKKKERKDMQKELFDASNLLRGMQDKFEKTTPF